ncbi:MAG: glycosyltransferase [Acidimicrobiia bacterium]|nr:glycosyltransferase [Acidimicrobiia bacterium]
MKVSILVPVFNERTLVRRSLDAVLSAPLPEQMERELIVVDDCSTDGTSAILESIAAAEPRIRLFRHAVNQGKGAAVRTAIEKAAGDFCIIQDADLEYDPNDYPALLKPLLDGRADAVFGSRYMAGEQKRVLPFWHSMINKTLTLFSNMFSNLHLTDMETCYKVFRTDLLKSIPIRSDRFGIEPEITMKSAKRKLRIYEVPVNYHGRTYEEGKKIGWKDGLKALGAILYFYLVDDLYVGPYGRSFLNNLTGTPQYVNWTTGILRRHMGAEILEMGAGIGTFAGSLIGRRLRYLAGEKDPLYLHALGNRFLRTPHVEVRHLDPADPSGFHDLKENFDTVLCLNVLEYMDQPEVAIRNAWNSLAKDGRLLLLVPQGPSLFGSLDHTLGHKRRFSRPQLEALLGGAGFRLERLYGINKVSTLVWFLNSRLLRASRISKLTLKLFDKTVWFWKLLDPLLPWRGLSLIAVARKPS